ncbi:CCA tRNA nucleotidyltransferase [Gordonia iterans]|uniref:CCA tRNA nucleotidyltransferase n=1 Tax=Gordonia iterans TaxID=1004901 RepID=A0A2S0KBV8_9ACTN|nr:CCA tRNA nucleotidyltransferase [Gordonia iterans]AVL99149.1 CCA tRNA nucleotidyltransferase [Gordonia iterans]
MTDRLGAYRAGADNTDVASTAQARAERRVRLLAAAAVGLRDLGDVLTPVAQRFAERGHELYLVGGSVRDAVLGRLGNDLDFTTDARPEVIAEILREWAGTVWDTGIEFGTVSAAKSGHTVEVTTFRADVYDRVSRNPQVTFGDTLEDDLIRRDFRINAMAVKLAADGSQEFCDPLDGMDDLLAGVIDTPAAPEDSFGDDPLRMLRGIRFVSQLGFELSPRTVAAITAMAGEIERITAERIQVELDKLICGEHPIEAVDLLVETGLADRIIPEIPGMKLTIDEHHQHKDVYQHSLTVLRQAIDLETDGPDPVLRWAALLHDIGKPATRRFEEGGGVSFHHHEVVGAKMTRKRLRALKFSKARVEDVAQLVFLHLRFHGYGEGRWSDSAVRRYVTDAGPLLDRLHKLVRADCTTRNRRRARKLQETYDDLEKRIAALQEAEDLDRIRPDLDGNAIMELLGLSPGPEVGQAWKYLKELRLDSGPLSREEAEAALLQWWAQRTSGPSRRRLD